MTHDVRQWLAEIEALRKKLSCTEQERDEAFKSAANWRKLYEQEAQQRRAEATLAQQLIDDLQEKVAQLQSDPIASLEAASIDRSTLAHDLALPSSAEVLREKLLDAIADVAKLRQALKQEQTEHERTRKTLMDALGDTMNALARERAIAKPTNGNAEGAPQRPALESGPEVRV